MQNNTNLLLISFFILFSFTANAKNKKDNKSEFSNPNIIYILADDWGYGDVKWFNPEGKIATPNLDRMAKSGIMFTGAHTTSAVCTQTHYGILK